MRQHARHPETRSNLRFESALTPNTPGSGRVAAKVWNTGRGEQAAMIDFWFSVLPATEK